MLLFETVVFRSEDSDCFRLARVQINGRYETTIPNRFQYEKAKVNADNDGYRYPHIGEWTMSFVFPEELPDRCKHARYRTV